VALRATVFNFISTEREGKGRENKKAILGLSIALKIKYIMKI
jgi:hypothetical protein